MPEGWKLRHGERVLKSKKEDRKNRRDGKEGGEEEREGGRSEEKKELYDLPALKKISPCLTINFYLIRALIILTLWPY